MPRSRSRRMRGFTLVETMVAGSILALLTCALLEGIIVATRISRDNSEHLAAEALAFDLAWMKFNEEYRALAPGTTAYNVPSLVPVLSSWPQATARTYVTTTNNISGKFIVSEVRWGTGNSKSVSHTLFRSPLSRVPGS